MRDRRRSVVWIAIALVLAALAITAAIIGFQNLQRSSPIMVSAVSAFNSGGLVPGPTVKAPSKNLGAVATGRDIWLEVSWKFFGELRTLDTVTVGDLRARRLVRSHDVPSSANSEIWFISAGSGDILENTTSTDIGFTFDGGNPSVTAQIYRVVGASEIPAAIAAESGDRITITIPADGIAFISLIASGTTSGSMSNVTEDFSALCGKDFLGIHASTSSTSAESETATFSGNSTADFAAVALQSAAAR
ncbi:hypothetical protein [Mesorhizobium sp. M0091]|uniref:hypothetical protein n=1 Tax=Mesorhizobium sp. M0091 TaxID=2956875 RepID=UPI00333BC02B